MNLLHVHLVVQQEKYSEVTGGTTIDNACFNDCPSGRYATPLTADPLNLDFSTRLVNGDDVTVGGRIQIYKPYGMTTGHYTYNSKYGWGTVCEEYFDNIDAKVTCRGINAITTDAYPTKKYGYVNSGYAWAWMMHMGCTGSEAQLNDCKRYNNQYSSSYYGWYGHRCAHYQDIGVICPPWMFTQLRMGSITWTM